MLNWLINEELVFIFLLFHSSLVILKLKELRDREQEGNKDDDKRERQGQEQEVMQGEREQDRG